MGRYKMSNVAISMNGVVKSWVGFSLATNVLGIAEGGKIEVISFDFVLRRAKTNFYELNLRNKNE